MKYRQDALVIARFLKNKEEFPFDPSRVHCGRRQHEKEPITPMERRTDFVVPLFSGHDILPAVPKGYPMPLKNCCDLFDEFPIGASV
jgi:hypothetical protein